MKLYKKMPPLRARFGDVVSGVIRLADSACIPADEDNRDYVQYLKDAEADPACVEDADEA